MTRVSVVIPCYNARAFLGETLESVLKQTVRPDEVLVVDDGSTDGSADLAASFGPLVQVVKQKNQGQSVARNHGLDRARGEWVAFLDSDDLWEPTKLERQLGVIDGADDVVCVFTDTHYFDDQGKRWPRVATDAHLAEDFRVRMLRDWGPNPSSTLCRTAVARQVRFPVGIYNSEDLIFFVGLREHGRFVRIQEPLTLYRRSSTQFTASPRANLESVRARHRWFVANSARFTEAELRGIQELLRDDLVVAHDLAFWARENAIVRECRAYHRALELPEAATPASFRWRLFPSWMIRFKDTVDRLLSTGSPQS